MNGWTIERAIVLILLIFAVFLAIFLAIEVIEEVDDDGDAGLRAPAALSPDWIG